MSAPRRTLLAAGLVAAVLLATPTPPVAAQDGGSSKTPTDSRLLDYALVQRTLPRLGELGDRAGEEVKQLHMLVEKLDKPMTTPETKEAREAVAEAIRAYMATKTEIKGILRDVLRLRVPPQTDDEIQDLIYETELYDINWEDATFRQCIKDLGAALGIPVRMSYHVVQMNRVSIRMRSAKASTVLASLCNYFELRWIIQDGEVILYKRITPNEARFKEWEEKHPGVKLRYWDRETVTGEYDVVENAGDDEPATDGTKSAADDMDIGFLRDRLLKLWIIEEASERHNQRKIADKSFKGMTPYEATGDEAIDKENREAYLKNDKHLRHYLTLELDYCIEAVDVCKRVLGKQLVAPKGDDAALEKLLEKSLPKIRWSGVTLQSAMADLSRKTGIPIDLRGIAKNETVEIDLYLDEGFLLKQCLEYVREIHYCEWSYDGATLTIKYLGGG